jgi:alpha-tubulin suppressor-like RCC1 family protein
MGQRIVRAVRRFVVPALVVTAVLLGTRTGRDVSGQAIPTVSAPTPAQATAPSTPSDTTTSAVSTPKPVASATVPSVSPSPASPSVTAVPSTPTTAVASVTPIPVAMAQATAASLVPVVIDGPGALGSPLRRLVTVPAVEPPVANPPGGGGRPGAQVQARSSSPVRIQGADGASFASITQGCGLTTAGKAYCWGSNRSGQLGDGTAVAERSVPVAVSGGLAFTSLADSGSHRCGLVADGKAYCWGFNGYGQLGDGTTGSASARDSANRSAPVAVQGGRTFTSLTARGSHTCGLTGAGTAYCWGANTQGQLGDGTSGNGDWSNDTANRSTPVAVSGGRTFTAIEAGSSHTCALDAAGAAYCWGLNQNGQLGDGTTGTARTAPTAVSGNLRFASITAGRHHSCGVTVDGPSYCWGPNYAGQLGDGAFASRSAPGQVAGGWSFSRLWAGDYHTCAITTAGAALCWGINQGLGTLGNGYLNDSPWPFQVSGGLSFTMVAPANSHTCGLATSGAAYCWGSNFAGNIGDGTVGRTTAPGVVSGGLSFTSILATSYGSTVCGLTTTGAAHCWGYNVNGQLGDGTTADRPSPVPVAGNLAFAKLVTSTNGDHRCGLTSAGSAYCWGTNWWGQVGNGTTVNRTSPVAVSGSPTFTSIVAGGYHTCGLTSAGSTYCWGYNRYGQLGNDTNVDQSIPVAVNTALKFSVLVAASYHTCGLTPTGLAYCWGSNSNGEIGDGTNTNRSTPVAVSGGYTFTSLSVGFSQTCGLTSAGVAYCWGSNAQGTLGDGTSTDRNVPTLVTGGLTFSSLVIGYIHNCGLTTAGAAYCWGQNFSGGLGDGTTTARTAPVAVSGGLTSANLVVGGYHTCGLTAAKVAYCWGRNPQLGDGTTAFERLTPVPVTGGLTFASLTAGNAHTCGVTPANVAYCWGERGLGVLGDGFVGIRTSPVAVNVAGIFWAPGSAPPVTLAAGWNHVAIGTYQATTLTAEDVCQAINTANGAGTIAEIDRWVNGAWEGHICGLPPNAFTLDRYTGYFLKLTRSATWTPPA